MRPVVRLVRRDRASQAYQALVVLAAASLVGAAARHWAPQAPTSTLLLVGLAVLAAQFPLHLEPNDRLDTTAGIYLCLLLLQPTPVAMVVVALAQLVGASISALRLLRRMSVKPKLRIVLVGLAFNAAQIALATGAGGALRDLAALWFGAGWADQVLAPIGAAVAFYLVNNLAVAMAISIDVDRSPLQLLAESARHAGFYYAILFATGAATARAVQLAWWSAVVVAIPIWLVYLALKRRVERIERSFAALESFADAVDARDPYTREHSKRVANYAVTIARELGIGARDVAVLRAAARVHDIGKASIPDSVLLKEGKLTEEEWAIMRRHPTDGYLMLQPYSAYERGKHLVLVHHENYAGGGYPGGMPLRELHPLAQIIPVADSIDAMRSDRPYRRGLGDEQIRDTLVAGRGRQWNPDVVDAAITALGLGLPPAAAVAGRPGAAAPRRAAPQRP